LTVLIYSLSHSSNRI